MTTENPYIFLKNNIFLQFLIADRFRIYRHITACVSLLAFFVLSKQWGEYEGIIDHWDWIEKWLGVTATFYLNMYVLMGIFYDSLQLLSQCSIMERLYDCGRNQNGIENSYFRGFSK